MPANNVDIFINGKTNFTQAAVNPALSGLSKLNEALHHTEGSLKSFNAIAELAFGFHVGRFFFEKVHEGLIKVGEGFMEARKHGEDFFQSFQEGIRSAAGIETWAQKVTKAHEEISEATSKSAVATVSFWKVLKPDFTAYPNVPGPDAARSAIRSQLIELGPKVGAAHAAISVADQGVNYSGFEKFIRANVANLTFGALGRDDPGEAAKLQALNGPLFRTYNRLMNLYTQSGRQALYNKNAVPSAIEGMKALFFGGFSPSFNVGATNFGDQGLPTDGTPFGGVYNRGLISGPASNISSLFGAVAGVIGNVFSGVGRTIGGVAKSREIEWQIQSLRAKLTSPDDKERQAGNLPAYNDRFRTTGVRGPNPLLEESKKQTRAQEEIREKIRQLTSKLNDLGVAGAQ